MSNLQMPFLTFLIFAKVRPFLMKVTDRHTDIHRNAQAHDYRQNRAVKMNANFNVYNKKHEA